MQLRKGERRTEAGRPYGHVPGHDYLDAIVRYRRGLARITIVWGSSQGYLQEHGRREYAETGVNPVAAVERVRDTALAEETDPDVRAYIYTACAHMLNDVVSIRRRPKRLAA